MDAVAYNTMMKANVKSGNLKGALEIYTEMKEAHVKPAVQTYTILISLFSKLGDLEKASQAFEVILSSEEGADEIAYSQMIHCFGSAGKPQDAANVFREMELRGYQPNEVIYNNLLDAYARAGCFQEARLLLGDMRRRGYPPTSVTYLLLISAYAANGKAADAESVLHLMQNPDCRHYNEVIRAHGNLGNISDACRVFSEMKAAGVDPELGCFRTLLKIHLDHGKFEQGLQMYKELSASFTLDQNLYGIVVDLCTRAERHAEADQFRAELQEKGFVYRSQRQAPPKLRTVPSIWRRSDHASVGTDDASLTFPEFSHST